MEMRSSGTLSDVLSGVIKDLIDQVDSSIQVHVIQKSVIEKLANNLCKSFLDVDDQDAIRTSQFEFVDLKSLERAQRLNLVFQRSGVTK